MRMKQWRSKWAAQLQLKSLKRFPPIWLRCSCFVAVLLLLAGCTTVTRLDAKFDSDALGALPLSAPAPTPPNDTLTWRNAPVTSTVVADPAGGRWVRIKPTQAFTSSPDGRRIVLIAG